MNDFQERMSTLTPQEQQVCEVLKKNPNLTLRGIGNKIEISRHTVDFHLRNVYRKTGVNSKTALVANLCKEK